MKDIPALFILLFITTFAVSQTKKIELFDLVKKLVQEITGYDLFGDWAIGRATTRPI